MTATGDTEIETAIEIPQVFKYHAFACHTQRPPGHPRGSCGSLGAQPLWDRLGKKLEAERLMDIGFTASGCLGFCQAGPLMVVYPDGIWYRPTTPEDIDEIVESHFKQGKLVERLVMILTRS
jgi:(2Fe-2S) ferredoxin